MRSKRAKPASGSRTSPARSRSKERSRSPKRRLPIRGAYAGSLKIEKVKPESAHQVFFGDASYLLAWTIGAEFTVADT